MYKITSNKLTGPMPHKKKFMGLGLRTKGNNVTKTKKLVTNRKNIKNPNLRKPMQMHSRTKPNGHGHNILNNRQTALKQNAKYKTLKLDKTKPPTIAHEV